MDALPVQLTLNPLKHSSYRIETNLFLKYFITYLTGESATRASRPPNFPKENQ